MIPDDERMRRAMHSLGQSFESDDADAPELFARAARGARRRGQLRLGGAMFGVVAVVCAAAVIPAALDSGSSSSRVATAGGDLDPGFTGVSPRPSQVVSPTPNSPTAGQSEPQDGTFFTVAPPTSLPKNSAGCPTVDSLPPGPNEEERASAAALAAAHDRYGSQGAKAFVTKVYPAASGQGFGIVADAICGKTLGDNSYVVELGFGDAASADSASMGSGQLFVADFAGVGWQVWFQYH
jgi:hypothetical protein